MPPLAPARWVHTPPTCREGRRGDSEEGVLPSGPAGGGESGGHGAGEGRQRGRWLSVSWLPPPCLPVPLSSQPSVGTEATLSWWVTIQLGQTVPGGASVGG